MDGLIATPEWERFRGTVQESSVDWAKAQEGVLDARNKALANKNLTNLTIHPNCRDLNLIMIETPSSPIGLGIKGHFEF
jgi:hypothetical protein